MKPIIFSTQMVKAILDGTKTQTREIIKPQPDYVCGHDNEEIWYLGKKKPKEWKYKPGDVLYVRETHAIYQPVCDTVKSDGRSFAEILDPSVAYRADGYVDIQDVKDFVKSEIGLACQAVEINNDKWAPSIFMPKWAARIFLKVKSVRVERVQDISEEDVAAEGMTTELFKSMVAPMAHKTKTDVAYYVNTSEDSDYYCGNHIDDALKKEQIHNGDEDCWIVTDAWFDTDVPCHCETCGVPLDCLLTKSAIGSELDHFEDNLITTPQDLFDIYRVLEYSNINEYPEHVLRAIKAGFRYLWDSLYKKRGYGWEVNPWVYAIEFEKMDSKIGEL